MFDVSFGSSILYSITRLFIAEFFSFTVTYIISYYLIQKIFKLNSSSHSKSLYISLKGSLLGVFSSIIYIYIVLFLSISPYPIIILAICISVIYLLFTKKSQKDILFWIPLIISIIVSSAVLPLQIALKGHP